MTTTLDTFDVFDTLLTRAVGDPTSLFLLLGRTDRVRELTGCGPEEYARLRVLCERRARSGRTEVTLEEIYAEMAPGLSLRAPDVEELIELELALEERLSRAVPEGRDALAGSRAGMKLAVSDMYLPADFVKGLLDRHHLAEGLDGVRVSAAERATKASGDLFVALRDETGVRPRHWCHHGDHAVSDIRVPRSMGIQVRPIQSARLNRYEDIWERHRWETGGFSSLISGASRAVRMTADVPAQQRPIVDVVCGVGAPILSAYVLWVLERARRDGLRRLYFLARDGEVLWLMAKRLAARLGFDIDLRYLYGSRSVYHRARLATAPLAEAEWAWTALYRVSSREVLLRLGLPPERAAAALKRTGLETVADDPVTEEAIATIVGDQLVAEDASAAAAALGQRIRGYLRQEGFCDGLPYGVADTGWAGRILRSLDEALPEDAGKIERAYLFGYTNRPGGFGNPDAVRGYLFDEHHRTGYWRNFPDAYGPLETFTVANHGSTVDFAERDGVVQPVLASPENPALAGWPWEMCRHLMLRFADELVLDRDIAHYQADLRSGVAEVLTEFWAHPTEQEAACWGRFVYEDDIMAQSRNHLAVPIQLSDFVQKASPKYEGKRLWRAGSVAISPKMVRTPARAGLWLYDKKQAGASEGPGAYLPPRWRSRAGILRNSLKVRARDLPGRGTHR